MATTTLTIDGNVINPSAVAPMAVRLERRHFGVSTLTLSIRGGPLPGLPDPWLGKAVKLEIDSGSGNVTYFQGDVVDMVPEYTHLGWVITYQCRCLYNRGDRVAMTDDNTQTGGADYNLPSVEPGYIAGRAGRTVGEIIEDVLTMADNAAALDARGLGGYVSLSPPTLPSSTLADLALLTVIPPSPCSVHGERLLSSIRSLIDQWAPNFNLWVDQATGDIRVSDITDNVEHTFTLGVDRIEPSPLRRSIADCYQRVVLRGATYAEPVMLSLLNGGLEEDFGYGALDNEAAKAAYVPEDFDTDINARSEGSCSCIDTLNVEVDPDDNTQAWGADEWDQTKRKGYIYLAYTTGAGITQFVTRRIVSNDALTAGGTAIITVDRALPNTNYDRYQIYGESNGPSLVYRKYKVTDEAQAAAMARKFAFPVAFTLAGANGGLMTEYPMGSVCWSDNDLPPFNEAPMHFEMYPDSGHIIFSQSLYNFVGNKPPSDVRALLAIYSGSLSVVRPASGYEGTSHDVEGMEETLVIDVPYWTDPVNYAAMETLAQSYLDAVKDTIVEGSVVIHDLFVEALNPGAGISITGSDYTTGWEDLNLPIREATLEWNSTGSGTHYTTTLQCSNRKGAYSVSQFLPPSRTADAEIGIRDVFDPFKGAIPDRARPPETGATGV